MSKFLCASLLTMGLSSSVFAANVKVVFNNSTRSSATVTFNGGTLSAPGSGGSNSTSVSLASGTQFTASVAQRTTCLLPYVNNGTKNIITITGDTTITISYGYADSHMMTMKCQFSNN